MAADVQLMIPHLEHQDTILVTDADTDSPLHHPLVTPTSPSDRENSHPQIMVSDRENSHPQIMVNSSAADSMDISANPLVDTSNHSNHSTQCSSTSTSCSPLGSAKTSSDNTSRLSATTSVSTNHSIDSGSAKYGELVVLGYNGSLTSGDTSRKKSKFSLCKRAEANGVKPSKRQFMANPKDKKQSSSERSKHSVSYTLSRTQAVVVEYEKDDQTDMFQIGRSSETPIDFVITDTISGPQRATGQTQVAQSTISRFSCRICVERKPPYTARIYAAGFDQHNHIFLGEKASKWYNQHNEIDGLTTNGVLITHPRGRFSDKNCTPGVWREASVRGGIYSLRETRSVPSKSQKVDSESNVLVDGTLIDLCGATLVWRSQLGLQSAPQNYHLEEYIEKINASRPQCPVGLNTLMLPKRNVKIDRSRQPYVYLACGHVHGSHEWNKGGESKSSNSRTCPMCFTEGPFVQVQIGRETSLYTDTEPLTHAFTPCAHMTSEMTARYWSSVVIPYGCQGFRAMCPYCATSLLNTGGFKKTNGYIKLIFQDNTEF